jgi:hypothetical protein
MSRKRVYLRRKLPSGDAVSENCKSNLTGVIPVGSTSSSSEFLRYKSGEALLAAVAPKFFYN